MDSSLHEKATEIIGKDIDLPKDQAEILIEKECAGNKELLDTVRELYSSIIEEDESRTNKKTSFKSSKDSTRRISDQDRHSSSQIVGSWNKKIFGSKRGRLMSKRRTT